MSSSSINILVTHSRQIKDHTSLVSSRLTEPSFKIFKVQVRSLVYNRFTGDFTNRYGGPTPKHTFPPLSSLEIIKSWTTRSYSARTSEFGGSFRTSLDTGTTHLVLRLCVSI